MSARKIEYSLQLKRKIHYFVPLIKEKSYVGARSVNYDFAALYRLFPRDPGVAFLLARFYIKNPGKSVEDYYKELRATYGCADEVALRDIRAALAA